MSKYKKAIIVFWIVVFAPLLVLVSFVAAVRYGAFGPLPSFSELENPRSNLATEVYSSDQVLLGTYFYQNRSNVSYKNLSPNLIHALKATEDIRFEEHSGVDVRGLFRVLFRTILLHQRHAGGGSTITQQLAKNLFPRNPGQGSFKTVITKIKEWITSVRLERNYTKEEILAMYFNTVEFGSNAFGIKSASRTFFNKPPDSLKVEEAATLVGLLKAPSYYSPLRNPRNATERRNVVLAQMKKYRLLTMHQFDSLKVIPIKLQYRSEDHNFGLGTYFREYLRGDLMQWCREHKKSDGTPYNIYRDGLKIYTTINSRMQKYAEEAVAEHLPQLQKKFNEHWKGKKYAPFSDMTEKEIHELMIQSVKRSERYANLKAEGLPEDSILRNFNTPVPMSIFSWKGDIDTVMSPMDSIRYYKWFMQCGFMSLEPQTGYIRAWVGGIDHRHFKYDHVRESRRQVGSAFKPFVYTLAMQEGYSPCFKVPNVPVTFINELGQKWTPKNAEDDDDGKMMSLREALAKSVNRVTAYLMKQFGPQAVVDIARRMGITSPIDPYPSICLGTPDISVYEMVGAYSTFANKGVWVEPVYMTRIEDNNGNVLQEFLPRKVDAISEETAYLMISLLSGVVQHGTGWALRGQYKFTQPMAGKTGTTQNHSDGWYIGITPELVSGGWVGCEDRAAHFRSIVLGQGATMSLPVWALYMQKVYADKNLRVSEGDFEKPAHKLSVETDCAKYKEPSDRNTFSPDGFR